MCQDRTEPTGYSTDRQTDRAVVISTTSHHYSHSHLDYQIYIHICIRVCKTAATGHFKLCCDDYSILIT